MGIDGYAFVGSYSQFHLGVGKFARLNPGDKVSLLKRIRKTFPDRRCPAGLSSHFCELSDIYSVDEPLQELANGFYISPGVRRRADELLTRGGVKEGFAPDEWLVPSHSGTKMSCHTIKVKDDTYICDCEAGEKGWVCYHATAVAKLTGNYQVLFFASSL